MYAPGVVKKNLKLRYSSSQDAEWLLAGDEFCRAADAAVSCIRNPAESHNVSLLKDSVNRFIFRLKVDSAGPDIPSLIVKSFPMQRLKQRLYQYRRYGAMEAANLLKAAGRGIPVPRVYGCVQIGRFCLVDSTAVMMEDLNRHRSICDLISSALEDSGKIELLKRAGRLLVRLYEGGCNHIDISAQSVWLSEADDDDRLIDFHYAAFHSQPSLMVLMFNMAYFGDSVGNLVFSEALLEPWAREVLAELSVTDTERWIEVYQQFKSKRLSRKQRLAIK